MATATKPAWTKAHEDALSGLVGLGLGKKYGQSLLADVPPGNLSDMMNAALRSHAKSKNLSPIAGGPQRAVPVNPPQAPPPLPSAGPRNAPPLPGKIASPRVQGQQGQPKGDALERLLGFLTVGGAKKPTASVPPPLPPSAPIGPAAAQLAPAAPKEKPRIRVRAAGGYVPPAPLGGQAPSTETASPTKEPETPSKAKQPVFISTLKEYEELEPGTEFMWPDGHIYEKGGGEK